MTADIAAAAAIVSVVGALVTITLGVWTARQSRQNQQIAAYRSVHELYDKMVQLKFQNPDFLVNAQEWDQTKMLCVYSTGAPGHETWRRYYTFVELCVGFSNAVLQAHEQRLMGDREYEKQWERLVRLVVAEHFPIISGFMSEGPYLSQYLRDYVRKTEKPEGWNWAEQHRALTWATTEDCRGK